METLTFFADSLANMVFYCFTGWSAMSYWPAAPCSSIRWVFLSIISI